MNEITRILSAIEHGDPHAAQELLPLVYDDLRKLAAAKLAQENPGQTLDATALVHEAYLRLVARPGRESTDINFADRSHFFRVAAEAMRRILIEQARRKGRVKHGVQLKRVPFANVELAADTPPEQLLALDAVLDRLAELDPIKAELVKLRYFVGLTEEETAAALGISRATASRYWTYARAWLINALDEKTE